MEQRPGYGILDGNHAYHRGVLTHVVEHLFESAAADELYLLPLEVQVCCNVVEWPYQSLYRYSFHATYQKIPLSLFCEAGPYFNFQLYILIYLRPTASQLVAK